MIRNRWSAAAFVVGTALPLGYVAISSLTLNQPKTTFGLIGIIALAFFGTRVLSSANKTIDELEDSHTKVLLKSGRTLTVASMVLLFILFASIALGEVAAMIGLYMGGQAVAIPLKYKAQTLREKKTE